MIKRSESVVVCVVSKAVLWLGSLNVSCSEDQLQAVVSLLSSTLVFGPVSSWGPEVFLEIGAFAGNVVQNVFTIAILK